MTDFLLYPPSQTKNPTWSSVVASCGNGRNEVIGNCSCVSHSSNLHLWLRTPMPHERCQFGAEHTLFCEWRQDGASLERQRAIEVDINNFPHNFRTLGHPLSMVPQIKFEVDGGSRGGLQVNFRCRCFFSLFSGVPSRFVRGYRLVMFAAFSLIQKMSLQFGTPKTDPNWAP